jgi:polyvinyl alcohol dehydrogenase (cytochrome)
VAEFYFLWEHQIMSLASVVLRTCVAIIGLTTVVMAMGSWKQPHADIHNTGFSNDPYIRRGTVNQLAPLWSFTCGDVSATPSVATIGGVKHAFFPDWSGNLFALNAATGAVIWTTTIASYGTVSNPLMNAANAVLGPTSRNTPTYAKGMLFLGDQLTGRVFAVNATNGNLIWKRTVDPHSAAMITQSPATYCKRIAGVKKCSVIVGVSSAESAYGLLFPGGYNHTFRGSVVSLDLFTGAENWRRYMIDDDIHSGTINQHPGYSGVAVWGSAAAIDKERNLVYITTGNNYQIPDNAKTCIFYRKAAGMETSSCVFPSKNRFDSTVALNLTTGAVVWSRSPVGDADVYNAACLFGPTNPNCINVTVRGPDGDFPQGVVMHQTEQDGYFDLDVVSGQQKSGNFWTFRRNNGAVVDHKIVGTSSPNGATWGSCIDKDYLVTVNPNANSELYTMINGLNTTKGIWTGIDLETLAIAWQIEDPFGGHSNGMVTCVPGVVLGVASNTTFSALVALNIKTGKLLHTLPIPKLSVAGPTIVDGLVLQGFGYGRYAPKTPVSGGVMAFAMPGAL